ncbi:MAG: helix-turn-helix domain-containing protein [Myxococcota bacterium]
MSHWEWDAPAALAPWILGLAASTDEGEPPSVRVLPDGGADLLCSAPAQGGAWQIDVFGPKRRALVVRDRDPMQKLAVRLRPGAAARWLGAPAHALADRALPLESLRGGEAHELAERLAGAASRAEQIGAMVGVLARRAADLEPPPPLVEAALSRTRASGGRLVTRTLARELGTSERQLERAFREHVGLGPKRFARIVRLGAAHRALAGGASQLEAALAAGYHDQAHLHRDARALAGVAPSAL